MFNFDVDDIKKDFRLVVEKNFYFSEKGIEKSINDIFSAWLINKKKFIDAFNGELTYKTKKKISFEYPEANKVEQIHYFYSEIVDRLASISTNTFEFTNYKMDFSYLIDFLSTEEFFDNHLKVDCSFCSAINGEDNFKFKKGTRVSKVFKTLFRNLGESFVDEVQAIYSTYIQKNKLQGYLVLSVHPLDFLSASENVNNWRSCHSLDGDYGVGNIQYMKDDVTFIGYLLSEDSKKYILPNFPSRVKWNSKIWRNYFFLKDDVLMRGNSYPFTLRKVLNATVNLIKEVGLIPNDENADWYRLRRDSNIKEKLSNFEINELYFNDLTSHSSYIPEGYFNREKYQSDLNLPSFNIGEDILCFKCGEENASRTTGECTDCYYKEDYDI